MPLTSCSGEEPSSSGTSLKGESVDEKVWLHSTVAVEAHSNVTYQASIDEKETAVVELKSYPVPDKSGTKVSRYLQRKCLERSCYI